MKLRTALLVGLLLSFSLLLAGCGDRITAEEIVAKVQETVESTADAHAVVSTEIDAQGIKLSVKAEVWERAPNQLRVEVLEASEASVAGAVLVSDGQQAWAYEPERNVVMVGPPSDIEMPLPQEMLTSLQDVIQQVLDSSDVVLDGTEDVADREAYKLILTPKEGTELEVFPGGGTATLWVDKEQWIVMKASYVASTFGEGEMLVESFVPNSNLPDELFHFEIPEGAEVIDVEARQPVPVTLDEAREQAGFPLLVPDYVPGTATLIEVFRVADSFVMRYDHSPEVAFTIVQGPELVGPPPLGAQQNVTVRGQSATAITDEAGGNTFLYWTENGVTVTIAGHISLDEALNVAASLQ
jgi:outer membrane lipoprotein-sorting protein